MDNENEEKTKLCELCFVSCDENFVLVDDDKRNMLETVRLELDFSASKEPIICKFCAENVEKCYEFKTSCLYTEDCITSFSSEKNDDKVDLLDVYLSRNKNKDKNNLQDHVVCRLCLELVKCGSHIPLNGDTKDKMFLNQFFPELDLNVIRDPVICALCHISLQDYIDFMRNYSDADITVQKLRADEADSNIGSELNLEPELLLKNTLKIENDCELKVDKKSHELDMIDEAETKPEYLGTEGEEFFLKSEPVEDEVEPNEPDSSPSFLSENRTVQATNNTYHCNFCKYKTDRRYNFQRHMGTHQKMCHELETETIQESPMYQCKSCSFKTKHMRSLRRHIIAFHNKASEQQVHSCDLCKMCPEPETEATQAHESSMYQCKSCLFKTKHMRSLKRHIIAFHSKASNQRVYSCDLCEYETTCKFYLSSHLLSHRDSSDATLYRCGECQYTNKYKAKLKRHKLVHQDGPEVKKFRCEVCQFQTKYKEKLSRHMVLHQDESEVTMYHCEHCKFKTKHKFSITKHLLTHKKKP